MAEKYIIKIKMINTISVIGIGRVGLPLSLAFCEAGVKVFGLDIDEKHVNSLKDKVMPFMEESAQELLDKHSGVSFIPTTETSVLSDSDAVIITLGTPIDDNFCPDYEQIESTIPILKRYLKKDQLIILRSTVSPGTTESLKKALEETGNICGIDFFLAFCPERIAEGKALSEIKEVPQIIGGMDPESTDRAYSLFSKISKLCIKTDARSAEIAKIFTNMYRYITFAIANEFSMIADRYERNIFEIIGLINKDYKRGGVPMPGLTAGPCLYKDGFFIKDKMPYEELFSAAWKINQDMPSEIIRKIKSFYGSISKKKIALLGMAFKKDIDDARNSLSYSMKTLLEEEGAEVMAHDPMIKEYTDDLKQIISESDIIIIAVPHSHYIEDLELISESKGKLVCDIWNITNKNKMIFST